VSNSAGRIMRTCVFIIIYVCLTIDREYRKNIDKIQNLEAKVWQQSVGEYPPPPIPQSRYPSGGAPLRLMDPNGKQCFNCALRFI
jgi:hypothetical protein